MFPGILLCILAGSMWSISGIIFSRVATTGLNTVAFMGITSTLTALFSWVGVVDWHVIQKGHIIDLPRLIIIMALAGLFNAIYQQFMLISMKRGHNAIAWTIAQSSMAIPFIAGILIWHDNPPLIKSIGVIFLLTMIIMLGTGRMGPESKISPKAWMPIVFIAFISVGLCQVFFSIPSRWIGWTDSAHLRLAISFTTAMVVNLGMLLLKHKMPDRKTIIYAICSATLAFTAQKVLFTSMDILSRGDLIGIAYPLASGICIVVFAFYSAFVIKEKFHRAEVSALCIGICGLSMLIIPH